MKAQLFLVMKYERMTMTLAEVCDEISMETGTAHNKLSAGTFPIPTRKEGRNRVADVRDVGEYIDRQRQEAKEAHETHH
jgi:predicted site-specific integrase-resolvase